MLPLILGAWRGRAEPSPCPALQKFLAIGEGIYGGSHGWQHETCEGQSRAVCGDVWHRGGC